MPSRPNLLVSGALACAMLIVAAASARPQVKAQAASPVTFVFTGHGYGHAVGLAQYGAFGYAQHGWTYDRILAHYYPGTILAPAPLTKIRVLLAEGRRSVTVASPTAFKVRDGAGKTRPLAAGSATVSGAAQLTVTAGGRTLRLPPPVTFVRGQAPLVVERPYRGSIEVRPRAGGLAAIDVVALDSYLYGVVTSEMPHDWPIEALKAQAVAARSYALSHLQGADFDVYADVRSQVYGGLDAEEPSALAAVHGTAGQVLLYNGRVAETFFSSSSGGRTAAITDVWLSSKPVPYLVSVPDPYDTVSPYHDWGPIAMSGAELGHALGSTPVIDLLPTTNAWGRIRSLVLRAPLRDTSLSASDFRRALGLRSTWFTIGVLSLEQPDATVVYGRPLELTGTARNLAVTLDRRTVGSVWQRGRPVAPGVGGRFSVPVTALATTDFRLATPDAVSSPVRVLVAPDVELGAAGATGFSGQVRPVLRGATVALQRLAAGGAWEVFTRTVVGTGGTFSSKVPIPAGTYRAGYSPGAGLVAGVSATRRVG